MNFRRDLSDAPTRTLAALGSPADDAFLGAGTFPVPAREQKALGSITFPRGGSSSGGFWGGWDGRPLLGGTLPGSDRNYVLDAGDPWLNPVVAAGIGWMGDNFGEPDPVIQARGADGVYQQTDDHDLIRLLDTPNPAYDADALWFATVLSFVVSRRGAFWIKAKSKSGKTLELWYVPHWEIEPYWSDDGRSFIDGYYHVVDGRRIPLEREDVVHFRRGLNPVNARESLPHLDAVLAEIATDNAGTVYSASILRNMGMPGVLISPASKEDQIDPDQQDAIKQAWSERTTGENRGKPMVSSGPLRVERLSLSPEDLALDKLRDVPEARICAALKLSPMVLNLPSARGFATFANYEQAVTAAYRGCLVPLQKTFAKAITRQLLPDAGGTPDREYFEWNYDNVQALAEDADKRAARAAMLFEKGVIKRGKACELVGVPCPPEDDVYASQVAAGGDVPAAAIVAPDGDGKALPPPDDPDPAVESKAREAEVLALAEKVLRRVEGELDGFALEEADPVDAPEKDIHSIEDVPVAPVVEEAEDHQG